MSLMHKLNYLLYYAYSTQVYLRKRLYLTQYKHQDFQENTLHQLEPLKLQTASKFSCENIFSKLSLSIKFNF